RRVDKQKLRPTSFSTSFPQERTNLRRIKMKKSHVVVYSALLLLLGSVCSQAQQSLTSTRNGDSNAGSLSARARPVAYRGALLALANQFWPVRKLNNFQTIFPVTTTEQFTSSLLSQAPRVKPRSPVVRPPSPSTCLVPSPDTMLTQTRHFTASCALPTAPSPRLTPRAPRAPTTFPLAPRHWASTCRARSPEVIVTQSRVMAFCGLLAVPSSRSIL